MNITYKCRIKINGDKYLHSNTGTQWPWAGLEPVTIVRLG